MCFCNDSHSQPDCNYRPGIKNIKKGEMFTVRASAVDQVNHTIANSTIHGFVNYSGSVLGEGQTIQRINSTCSDLTYSITSQHKSEQLILYVEGPCNDGPLSRQTIHINFEDCTCSIGFQPKEDDCKCECASGLQHYFKDQQCDQQTGILTREGNFWITYINASADHNTSGYQYLTYQNCPKNYCKDPTSKVSINLSMEFGADEQCMKGRTGILCGACKSGYSLSLGSVHCLQCPSHWYALLVVITLCACISGIALIALILTLNMTVAVGSLNGIIFYANVVMLVTPDSKLNFNVSWINLNIGFDTCFFEGMDAYWKTLIELLFPLYVIILVIVVIILCECSFTFSRLLDIGIQ